MAPNQLLTSRAVIGHIYNRLTMGDTSWVNRYAMRIPSNQETESYAWLGHAPTMARWVGERQTKGMREYSFSVTNDDHQATLEILVKHMRRDMSGQIMIRAGDLARRTLTYPAKLISALMEGGAATVCYDGQYFFSTTHSEGDSGTQSNKITVDISELPVTNKGSTTAPSVAQMRDSIMMGVQQILGLKDDQGEPMNEGASDFEVMVPTSLWAVAQSAVALPMVDSGDANIIPAMGGLTINIVVNSRLTWTDRFTITRTDADTKPYILQEEVPVEVSAVAEGSELHFKEKKHWYGVDWSGEVAYGFWQHAAQVILA